MIKIQTARRQLTLDLAVEPKAYAEAILKAAERSFLTDVVHQAASFNSRRTLERRIDMIMNTNRTRRPLRQWPFLGASHVDRGERLAGHPRRE